MKGVKNVVSVMVTVMLMKALMVVVGETGSEAECRAAPHGAREQQAADNRVTQVCGG